MAKAISPMQQVQAYGKISTRDHKMTKAITLAQAPYIRQGATTDGATVLLHQDAVDPIEYKDVQLYTLPISRGEQKGELAYYVALADYKPRERKLGLKDQAVVDAMMASGMTEEQALAVIATARQSTK